jgi:nanoRNase/pAp phosphatase (c-di-AMP/oligoRNAs hydrolase)
MVLLSLPESYASQRRASIERRVQQTLELLSGCQRLLILMHNDPDPDAMASGLASLALLRHFMPDLPVTLAHGGIVGRAENRQVAELFLPDLLRIPTPEAAEALKHYDAVALVDTQPSAGNHLLYGTNYPAERIILAVDHHPPRRSQVRAQVHDVRPEIGACCTMFCEYLAVSGVPLDKRLATALFYGIKSDTRGLSRHTDELDIWAYSALRNQVDTDLLNRIEHVQLPRTYFRAISDALNSTTLYHCPHKKNEPRIQPNSEEEEFSSTCTGDVAVSLLFDLKRPDMASEIADLLLRLQGVSWAICLGIYQDRLVISVRTDVEEARAGRLVRTIVGKSGTAGGHNTMAGGRIHLPDATPSERVAELHALVPRFLQELGVANAQGIPLLSGGDE